MQKQIKEVFLAPGDNLRLIANKSKANITESVLLSTYGCDYGFVEWKIGNNTIMGNSIDPKREITQTGPGLYQARCKEDFSINTDWVSVYVDIDGSIVPVINGPASLCPNTAATLTTPGCPNGYYNSWSTLEQGGFSYGGNSITVYLPQTVKLRCIKNDNSWGSDEKPFTIQSSIPDDIKATSNSPIVNGGTAQLAGTAISGASYLWTAPQGVNLTVPLNKRTLQIPNITDAYAGEYTLQVSSGGCVVNVSTRLDVNLCDNLFIRAFDPLNGEEKNRLARKSGEINLYDDLVLQVETFEGEVLKGVEYTWTLPQGVTAYIDSVAKYKATINKIGNYKVNVSSTGGISCPLEIDISALACATPADFTNCGATGSVSTTGTEKLKNLAVGDEFSTYDYIVMVTEVTGSEANGWTGKGRLNMNFLKIGSSPVVEIPLAVTFTNMHLNQCYQILPGSKVITEFDPSWSNVVDVDDITDRLNAIYAEIKDILAFDPTNTAALQDKITELNGVKADLTSSGLRPEYIAEQKTAQDNTTNTLTCYVNAANARNTNSCSVNDVLTGLENAENTQKNSTKNPYFGDVFDMNGNYIGTNSGGVFPQIVLKNSEGKYILINKQVLNVSETFIIAKIMMKYFDELSLSRSELLNQSVSIQIKGSRGFNYPNEVSTISSFGRYWWSYPELNMLVIHLPGGHLGDLPVYINNAKSLLYHEYLHLSVPFKGGDNTKEGIIAHIQVYENQVQHQLFGLCTVKFKNLIRSNLHDYLEELGPNGKFKDMQNYKKWQNRLKKLGL